MIDNPLFWVTAVISVIITGISKGGFGGLAKLLPYAMLGQFDKTNLTTSLILIPLAPIGVLIGVWLLKRIDQDVFYRSSCSGMGWFKAPRRRPPRWPRPIGNYARLGAPSRPRLRQ